MSDAKEITFAGFAALFRLGPEKITMTKADAARLAEAAQVASDELKRLRAERNAEISARMKAEGEFSTMQRRIARQRRTLAKLYQRRNNKNTQLSGFLTGMTAALATARRDGMEALLSEARHDLAAFIDNAHPHREKYPHIMQDFENDMEIVQRIDAALEGK